jgi:NAD(P)-dependent dehydrogenase (short-subunit alcohol dehydrogenase family)
MSPEAELGQLTDKVCVITGASGAIGSASVKLFAEAGARVVGIDLAQGEAQPELFLTADLTDEDLVRGSYAQIAEKFGRIDVLFNNAGICPPEDGSVLTTDLTTWQRVLAVNLTSIFLCCKHGIPHLLKAGGGSVINTCSLVATLGSAVSQISYTASKGGILALSRELAVEFARRNVRVNALSPGPVQTPMLRQIQAEDRATRHFAHIPNGLFARPEEIAAAAVFLAGDASSYVSGTNFLVDGAISAAYVTPEDTARDPEKMTSA